MKTALDTNVLSSLFDGASTTSAISRALHDVTKDGPLSISAMVYAELLAHPQMTVESLNSFLTETLITVEYLGDRTVWVEAGVRYARYAVRRRRATGEAPRRMMADFIIGAHALVHADRLMTFDKGRFATDFPDLRLHSPVAD